MNQKRCLATWGLLTVFCFSSCTSADVNLPPGFQVCRQSDPRFDQCLLEVADINRELLSKGYPELGIPPINPWHIPTMELEFTQEPAFSVTVKNDNLIIEYDVERFVDVKMDQEKQILSTTALLSRLTATGVHTSKGKIAFFGKVNGHGASRVIMENTMVSVEAPYSIVQKDGEDYMHLDDVKINLTPKKVTGDFENIVSSPSLTKIINRIMNNNWESYFLPAYPAIGKQLGAALKEDIKGLFDNVPYTTLFPL